LEIGVVGQGRLGSALTRSLISSGFQVSAWARTMRDDSFPIKSRDEFKTSDLDKFDSIVLASGLASPVEAQVEEELSRTIDLLPSSLKRFPGRVYYLSSGAVYGDCEVLKTEQAACRPVTAYGNSKYAAELALRRLLGDRLTIIRIGNLIPSKMDFGIFKMIASNYSSKVPITFQGAPSDCRDYLYEVELINILAEIVSSGIVPGTINLGSGIPISLGTLAQILQSYIPDEMEIRWSDRRLCDVGRTQLDVGLLNSLGLKALTHPEIAIRKRFQNLSDSKQNLGEEGR
jgi:nucleoside-diphosphate-sugar epimerase